MIVEGFRALTGDSYSSGRSLGKRPPYKYGIEKKRQNVREVSPNAVTHGV